MDYNCSSLDEDLMYAELYEKIVNLEKEALYMLNLMDKLTNIIDFMIQDSIHNNGLQTRINNDIIIIFVIILIILLYLFKFIKPTR
jgi:hypothetical protein